MMIPPKFEEITEFKWRDLHKKIGQIVVIECGDSDINEGNFINQVWFRDQDNKLWLLHEWDIRAGAY